MSNDIVITGDAYWACLHHVNEMSDKYQMDLCNLTPESIKKIQEIGIEVKRDDVKKPEQGYFVTLKSERPAVVLDSKQNVIKGIGKTVGNGSKVKAAIRPYEWTFKNKSGVSGGLGVVMILDLVKYEDDEEALDINALAPEEGGFVHEPSPFEVD